MRYVDCTDKIYRLPSGLDVRTSEEPLTIQMNRPIEEIYDWVLWMLKLDIDVYIKVVPRGDELPTIYPINSALDLKEVYQILDALSEKEER